MVKVKRRFHDTGKWYQTQGPVPANTVLSYHSHTRLLTIVRGSLQAARARGEYHAGDYAVCKGYNIYYPSIIEKHYRKPTLTIGLTNPFVYPRKTKTYFHKKLYANVYSGLIHNHLKLETPRCPSTGQWRDTRWYTHTTELHSATLTGQSVNGLHLVDFPINGYISL